MVPQTYDGDELGKRCGAGERDRRFFERCLDVDEVRDGAESDQGVRRASYRETTLPGALLTAAGGAAIVTAGVLWFWPQKKGAAISPSASVTETGAWLGVAGAF